MSQTSSTYVWRYEREGGPDGRPSAPLEHGDRSRLRAVMASSEFPGSHGPGNGKRGGGHDLRPSTPSKGEKAKKGSVRPVSNGSGWRWGRPSPYGRSRWQEGRVAKPRRPPSGIGGSADAAGIPEKRDPMSLGETISPSKGPRNRHPIGLGADGEPVENGLPRFSNRGKGRCRPRGRAG